MSVKRDDFPEETRQLIAKRAGYICSYPDCGRMTVAISPDRKTGLTMTGVAAHITAASIDGPRFDKAMSSEERKSERNGIWTCQIHGKFIDDNSSKCTTEELRRFKYQHEKWVFDRVESGKELNNKGINKVKFENIGIFKKRCSVPLGRINVVVGDHDLGVNTFCHIISCFSNVNHWNLFYDRYLRKKTGIDRSSVEVFRASEQRNTHVKISPQTHDKKLSHLKVRKNRIHIEVDQKPSIDWPRSEFNIIHFNDQLYRLRGGPQDSFVNCIRYLADLFNTSEDLLWDSFRDEFFASSLFGYRIKRNGWRKLNVLVPNGREFYLPHTSLSFTEQQFLFLELAIALQKCHKAKGSWMFIFDLVFFNRMDNNKKESLFREISSLKDENIQAIFCLVSEKDAEELKKIESNNWVNAVQFNEITVHSFL